METSPKKSSKNIKNKKHQLIRPNICESIAICFHVFYFYNPDNADTIKITYIFR